MIDASLNEVESLAWKAARGAGLAWGLADDTGKAARWLAACDLPWAESLIQLLAMKAPFDGGPQSPLVVGSYLADLACVPADDEAMPVAHPLWLLPFAGRIAAVRGVAIVVGWNEVSVSVWPMGGDVAGDPAALTVAIAQTVRWGDLRPGKVSARPAIALANNGRCAIVPAHWDALEMLGARTYVPASAQSRAKGAGSDLTDND
jgi:Protein of unknown function (DUF3726)